MLPSSHPLSFNHDPPLRAEVRGLAKQIQWEQTAGMSAIQEIEKTVLALPVEQRVLLAESLLRSLPPVTDEWSEAEELAEVERREREIENGQVQPLSDVEFWKRIQDGQKR